MAFTVDPQVMEALAPLLEAVQGMEPLARDDALTRRAIMEPMFTQLLNSRPPVVGVDVAERSMNAGDGTPLDLRWYTPSHSALPGSAVYYVHGGGMILGNFEMYDQVIRSLVVHTGVPVLAVEYRLAPEHPHPTPVEDCYGGLLWLAEHAADLDVDPGRIAVMGDSAGGGLAAAVALLARDRGGPAIAQQILVYPMLDDRNTSPDPDIAPFATWTYDDNHAGWNALLGGAAGSDDVPFSAAPARAENLAGLPPAYVEVGVLDAFRDEDIEYARRLVDAGIDTELHVHPGCVHGFETFAPDAQVSRRALADRHRRIGQL